MARKPTAATVAKVAKPNQARHQKCDCSLFRTKRLGFSATGFSVDDLDLEDYVAEAAKQLLKDHPEVVFTSGRRDKKKQAEAMAGNVVKNKKWIEQTYKASTLRDQLQKWVDDHPEATTKADIAAGLLTVMDGWSDAQLGAFSRHLTGEAFDVSPVADGDDIKKAMQALPNVEYFTDKEGGLVIWHVSFKKPK